MMRLLIPAAAALALFTVPALAQTDTQTPAQPAPATTQAPAATAAPSTAAPSETTTPAPKSASKHRSHRVSLQQRFDAANATHDGHLTKDQAAAANWPYVVNNFTAIDKDKKGYVTVQDIHNFAAARRAAAHHHATPPATTQPAAPSNG